MDQTTTNVVSFRTISITKSSRRSKITICPVGQTPTTKSVLDAGTLLPSLAPISRLDANNLLSMAHPSVERRVDACAWNERTRFMLFPYPCQWWQKNITRLKKCIWCKLLYRGPSPPAICSCDNLHYCSWTSSCWPKQTTSQSRFMFYHLSTSIDIPFVNG